MFINSYVVLSTAQLVLCVYAEDIPLAIRIAVQHEGVISIIKCDKPLHNNNNIYRLDVLTARGRGICYFHRDGQLISYLSIRSAAELTLDHLLEYAFLYVALFVLACYLYSRRQSRLLSLNISQRNKSRIILKTILAMLLIALVVVQQLYLTYSQHKNIQVFERMSLLKSETYDGDVNN